MDLTNGKIVSRNLETEMKESYIDYSMSVIVGRALPDVRDGLKPVHRRVLWSMYEQGITPDKPHKKKRPYRRRRHGQIPSPWRQLHLRYPGTDGPAFFPCAIYWWTATATSVPSTATAPPPCANTEARLAPLLPWI